jgi:hypothetical protein
MSGDAREALRYADSVRRIVPNSFTVVELCGRLWCAIGEHQTAYSLFSKALRQRSTADAEAAFVESMLGLGNDAEALQRLGQALRRFAVLPDGRLAEVARLVLSRSEVGASAWVGLTPSLELVCQVQAGPTAEAIEFDGLDGLIPPTGTAEETFAGWRTVKWSRAAIRGLSRLKISANAREAVGSDLANPPDFGLDARTVAEGKAVRGWVSLAWHAASAPRRLVAEDTGGRRASVPIGGGEESEEGRRTFSFRPEQFGLKGDSVEISAIMPDGTLAALPDSPVLRKVRAPPLPSRPTVRAGIRPLAVSAEREAAVVIPVYAGLEDTLQCIASVRATCPSSEAIVVNDASPDAGLVRHLAATADDGAITLVHNRTNLGFPGAVNRGLALADDRDVVLLNADTEVYGDWLSRLRAAAYSAPDIATVTPFGSDASKYPI